ncbi:MAG: STAS domain-containing protein [Desulfobacteraceae bacterium]|nr:STAS domain-containing protein [Desulfobacteraceae bacterium]
MGAAKGGSYLKLLSNISAMLKPSDLLPAMTAGGTNAILIISVEMSLAAMLFSQELSVFIPRGIGLLLAGTFIMGMFNALKSSHPSNITCVQDAPVAILSLPLLAISSEMSGGAAPGDEVFYTLIAAISISTIFTGIFMVLMAKFKLGNFVRFIPYPVIGGFLAGIGWLLFKGGLGVMTGIPFGPEFLLSYMEPLVMLKWVPGLSFGIFLYYVLRNYSHFLILPCMVLGAVLLFFAVLLSNGIPFEQAEAGGWFLGPFPEGALWKPFKLEGLMHVRWDLVFSQALTMGSIFIVSVISLLLNNSGLELITRRDIDLNRELHTTGLSNMVSGFAGSPAGYLGLSAAALCHKLSPGNRMAGLTSFGICGITLLAGASILSGFPRPLAGAMLVLMGIDMLWEWLVGAWKRLPRSEYFMVLTIVFVIAGIGFLEGVGTGLVIAVILFVVTYSRIDIVRSESTGKNIQSNVERPAPHRWILDNHGNRLLVLRLHGFLFFGTANQLRNRIIERAGQENGLDYVVLDFTNVNGFDSTALNSFERICQFAEGHEITLVFVNLSDGFMDKFKNSEYVSGTVKFFSDLDRGIEWCEDKVLKKSGSLSGKQRGQVLDSTFDDMVKALEEMDNFEQIINKMAPYLEMKKIEQGDFLFHQGEAVNGIYFIESGRVSLRLQKKDGSSVRLRTMGAGALMGEPGELEEHVAVTSAVVKQSGKIFHLTNDNFFRMEKENPELAFELYKLITKKLSDRLVRTSRMIQGLFV